MGDLSVNYLHSEEKIMFKSQCRKLDHRALNKTLSRYLPMTLLVIVAKMCTSHYEHSIRCLMHLLLYLVQNIPEHHVL
jgi:hypothetical protein